MHFGMPTLIEIKSIESCCALCSELGLDFVEISMDMPDYQEEKLDVDELRRIAKKYDIYYTIHLEGFLDPCAFNKRVVAAYTETVLKIVDIAKQLNVPILNMHLNRGDYISLPHKKVSLYDEYKVEYLNKLTAFRDFCTSAIGGSNIKICVENCSNYDECSYIVDGLDLLLVSPVFALTFDIGHNASGGFTDEPVLIDRSSRLTHMHLHDAKSSVKRDHLTLGEGELDLLKYLDMAQMHSCRAVIEVKTIEGLRKSVQWLKERSFMNG